GIKKSYIYTLSRRWKCRTLLDKTFGRSPGRPAGVVPVPIHANSEETRMLYPIQNEVRNRLDLSGIWDFQTDAEGVGEQAGWATGLPAPRPIAVPGSWNEQYEDLFNYLGLAW